MGRWSTSIWPVSAEAWRKILHIEKVGSGWSKTSATTSRFRRKRTSMMMRMMMRKSRIDDCVSHLICHMFPHAVSELRCLILQREFELQNVSKCLFYKKVGAMIHIYHWRYVSVPCSIRTNCWPEKKLHSSSAWGGRDAADPRCQIWVHVFDPNSLSRKNNATCSHMFYLINLDAEQFVSKQSAQHQCETKLYKTYETKAYTSQIYQYLLCFPLFFWLPYLYILELFMVDAVDWHRNAMHSKAMTW